MRSKILCLTLILVLTQLVISQPKFRVEKINTDSLFALLPDKEGTELIDALNLLSNAICRKDIDSSISLANRAINLSIELDYKKGLADGYFNLGNGYFLRDTLEPTITNYMKALRIYEGLEPTEWYGDLCLNIAAINYMTGRDDVVIKYAWKGRTILERFDNKEGLYNANFAMAIAKHTTGPVDIDSAVYFCHKAISYLNPEKDQNYIAVLHREIAIIYRNEYYETKDTSYLSKSLAWHYKALNIPEISDRNKIWFLSETRNMWNEFNTPAALDSADACLQKMIYLEEKDTTKYDTNPDLYMVLSCLDTAKARYQQGNIKQTIVELKQALTKVESWLSGFSANDYHDPGHGLNAKYYLKVTKEEIHYYLYILYTDTRDFEKALENYKLSKQAEEEIFLKRNQDFITMLEVVAKDEKTQSQIDLLARDNELNKTKAAQSRAYMLAMGGFVIILILVTIIFIRQRKTRLKIREQKLIYDLELKEIESKKLKELDQLKSRFFANISHEFRTPLTLILSPAEKLLNKVSDKSILSDLQIIHRYARRLRRLINQLLNLSKLEAGELKLNTKKENIIKLVKSFTQSFESLAKQRQIELFFSAESEEKNVSVDRNKLEIIINNLLSNAFKFTPEKGRIEVVMKEIADEESNVRHVQISVSDSGVGIPEEDLDKIFERFYMVDDTNSRQHEGTGIGLALAKELVELHHGEIKVESIIEKGTTFRIILPIDSSDNLKEQVIESGQTDDFDSPDEFFVEAADIVDPNEKLKQMPELNGAEEKSSEPVLLIVDDNPDLRAHISFYLSDNYRVLEARDGEEGLAIAIDNIPDLIISDVMMPKVDGYELSKLLKSDERTSHIPVILLTARASKESRIEGLETGADDFITKPFDVDELLVRIKNLIEQRKKISQLIEKKIRTGLSNIQIDFADSGITSIDEKFMHKVMKVLKEHYGNPEFNISEFGQIIGQSTAQLNRKMRALTGQSSAEFIRIYRLTIAAEMIKKKSASISEIAYDVGFNSPSYFSECFKVHFGKLPSEFNDFSH